jgi:hypothetical protein
VLCARWAATGELSKFIDNMDMNVRSFRASSADLLKKAILGLIHSPQLLISLADLLNVMLIDLSVSLHITTLHMWEGILASTPSV